MKQDSPLMCLGVGVCLGMAILALVISFFPKNTIAYRQAVKDIHKEAFENGLMIKEINKDDQVIYRWIHTEKLGYE